MYQYFTLIASMAALARHREEDNSTKKQKSKDE